MVLEDTKKIRPNDIRGGRERELEKRSETSITLANTRSASFHHRLDTYYNQLKRCRIPRTPRGYPPPYGHTP